MVASTKNPQAKPVNQKRGPTTGNSGTPGKAKSFTAEKSRTGSYRSELARMVSDAFGARGQGMKPNQPNPDADKTALRSISPNTKTRRGPTRG